MTSGTYIRADLFIIKLKHLGPAINNASSKGERWGASVNRVVEFPGAGLGRLITINSELNGAIQTSEAATEAGRASVSFSK